MNTNSIHRFKLFLFWALCLMILNTQAQTGKALQLTLQMDTEDNRWDSLTILIRDDQGLVRYQKGHAVNKFVLPYQHSYSISFSKPGTLAKHVEVDTHIPLELAHKKSKYFIRMRLSTRPAGIPTPEEKAMECKTEVTVFYNALTGVFDYKR